MNRTLILATLATAVALQAVPAAAAKPAARQPCFSARQVNGFTAVNDRTINVRVGVRDIYQFKLMTACPDVRWNERLALVSRGSDWICSGLDAEVVTRTPIGPQRCPVSEIHKLTPAEAAALPKKQRP
jgi:hypothetical protein